MSHMNLQGIVSAKALHFKESKDHGAFSVAQIVEERGFMVNLYVTADQADAIAAIINGPKVNSAGIPVFEGRAA